ncbi:DUF368 domain-containing protein [Bacillus alkalicellulosilyticus]|uniref:DUF368 domain-containing protein n=1 Tax=Alkalihalobacterium alkalicellulosilyticum TaxID=1912214 RepID=UPI0009978780|nr:DUF368 domain-containing protein [Bacillus alkalicellulosilyticus]
MLKTLYKGMAVGITETVPGVSGSTVAMILGIYEKLLYSISIITTPDRRKAIPFLVIFGLGMIIGFACSIFTISFLLDNFRTQTLIFFVGIIVGFLPQLWNEARRHSLSSFEGRHYVIIALFFFIVVIGQILGSGYELSSENISRGDYIFLFGAGLLASTALVLPGISGALILTILGVYEIATQSLLDLHLPIIIAIGLGVIAGVLFTSKVVRYLLEHFTLAAYAAMVGLVSGSIIAIFNEIEGTITIPIIIVSVLTFNGGLAVVHLLKPKHS